jgi:hypothetical protein
MNPKCFNNRVDLVGEIIKNVLKRRCKTVKLLQVNYWELLITKGLGMYAQSPKCRFVH